MASERTQEIETMKRNWELKIIDLLSDNPPAETTGLSDETIRIYKDQIGKVIRKIYMLLDELYTLMDQEYPNPKEKELVK